MSVSPEVAVSVCHANLCTMLTVPPHDSRGGDGKGGDGTDGDAYGCIRGEPSGVGGGKFDCD